MTVNSGLSMQLSNKPTLYISKRNFNVYARVMALVSADENQNFSDWVLEACRQRLERENGNSFDVNELAEAITRRILSIIPSVDMSPPPPAEDLGQWFK